MKKYIPKFVTCPRCREVFEWEYKNPPSPGWICRFCRGELNMNNPSSHFRLRPMNDMEERKLDEDLDCDPSDLPQFEASYQDSVLEGIFEDN